MKHILDMLREMEMAAQKGLTIQLRPGMCKCRQMDDSTLEEYVYVHKRKGPNHNPASMVSVSLLIALYVFVRVHDPVLGSNQRLVADNTSSPSKRVKAKKE